MKNAYVVWGFPVGAAVLAEDDKMYGGCNIESWISGIGTCAERCAIDHAVLHGNRKIREIAVVMNESDCNDPKPCGVCLQYIHDFAEDDSEVKIVMSKTEKNRVLFETVTVKTLGQLLPSPYKRR